MHSVRIGSLLVLCLMAPLLIVACRQPDQSASTESGALHFDFGQPAGMTRAEYAEHLSRKAHELARSELARMSAIELLYRNKVYYHGITVFGANITGGAYARTYRQFVDYELVDITRSDSILNPLTIEIAFKSDIYGTDAILVQRKDPRSARLARESKDFKLYRHDTTLRRYPCDENGDPIGALPPPPPRPNYWDKGREGTKDRMTIEAVDFPLNSR